MNKFTIAAALITATGASAATGATELHVSLGTHHSTYMTNVDNGGSGKTVRSSANSIDDTVTMYMKNLSDTTCIRDGSLVSIRSDNGYYWRANANGGLHVDVNTVTDSAIFEVINHSDTDSCIAHNDKISLYNSAYKTYAVAESDGRGRANRTSIGAWETFTITLHSYDVPNRKTAYRDKVLTSDPNSAEAMPIMAYAGEKIPSDVISDAIDYVIERTVADFRLTQLVRVLYFSNGDYEDELLPTLSNLRYWLTEGEEQYVYWSENHIIMWTSAAYLMRQKYGWPMDSNLDDRLAHYLDLKLKHGFYEFFSTDYYRFTLAALLNLADFAEDEMISSKAALVAKKMLSQLLMVVNNSGAFYPAAGRNYNNKYTTFDAKATFWMLTGKGPMREDADFDGPFFATTSVDFNDVALSFDPTLNVTVSQGHAQSDNSSVHSGMSRIQRTIFQWSSGGYFHPDTASDTAYTVDELGLENRSEFSDLASAAFLPDSWLGAVASVGATYSRGSSISHSTVKIYKNYNIVLTSLDNFYPGYRGYQQWPWAATIGDIAVWTQSGTIPSGWDKSGSVTQNAHLPKVQQNGNVAMITYFPNYEIRQGTGSKRVTLHWPTDRFDEHGSTNGWLVARKNTTYIAVRRPGSGLNADGYPTNWGDKGRQMWAVVVGNIGTHGSYDNFLDMINAASVKETFNYDWAKFRNVYYTRITVDGKTLNNWW